MHRAHGISGLSPIVSLFRDALICIGLTMVFSITFSTQAFQYGNEELATRALSSDLGSPIEQAMTLFVFANSLILARLSGLNVRTIALNMAPIAVLLLLALSSVLWSDYPILTLRRASRLVVEVSAVYLLALTYRDECERVLRILFRLFAIITLANLAALALPSMSFTPIGFRGIHQHKLDAGRFFFFAIPVFAIGIINPLVSKSRLVAAALMLIAVGLMPITSSKTAFVCVPLAIVLTLSMRSMSVHDARVRGILLVIYALIVMSVVLIADDIGTDTLFDKAFGDVTLTGRDNIWRFALDRFMQRPFFGVGFGALWQTGPDVIQSLTQYNAYSFINQAHNGYIDILAQLGLVGLALYLAFLVIVFIRLNTAVRYYEIGKGFGIASYGIYLLLGSVIYNFTDSTYLWPGRSMWIMLLFVVTCATARIMKDRAFFSSKWTIPLTTLRMNRGS
jgi:exopolysaccharide production protein ExoQ